jgi:UDP-N-acetylmuramoyl-L-alanyl-D-glutamate--2,6-diaminopimelate ligase
MFQKIKNIYHLGQAIIANIIYGFPGRKLTVIGVTGTDGKTTTTSIIYHILKSAGKKTAMITSVGAYIGDKVYDIGFHVTTPSPFGLQKYIRKAVDDGVEYLVLETTSHALDQNRVWGIPYKIAVLTNITHEHLDYHKSYEEYAETKFKLLNLSNICIVNKDDNSWSLITSQINSKLSFENRIISYSLLDKEADFTPKKFPFTTQLLGKFNQSNSLAAIAAVKMLNISDSIIRQSLATFTPPPGRQEIVYDKEFKVIIDFAHTPNAFAKILPEVKRITRGRLIHVFGSAGKRDATKRPEMGRESSHYADIIILTAEDPRNEKIEEINKAISDGINSKFKFYASNEVRSHIDNSSRPGELDSNNKVVFEIPNRKEAIEFAINLAQKGDTVILTGKSHEKSMNLGRGEEPWDEFKVARDAIEKKVDSLKN